MRSIAVFLLSSFALSASAANLDAEQLHRAMKIARIQCRVSLFQIVANVVVANQVVFDNSEARVRFVISLEDAQLGQMSIGCDGEMASPDPNPVDPVGHMHMHVAPVPKPAYGPGDFDPYQPDPFQPNSPSPYGPPPKGPTPYTPPSLPYP